MLQITKQDGSDSISPPAPPGASSGALRPHPRALGPGEVARIAYDIMDLEQKAVRERLEMNLAISPAPDRPFSSQHLQNSAQSPWWRATSEPDPRFEDLKLLRCSRHHHGEAGLVLFVGGTGSGNPRRSRPSSIIAPQQRRPSSPSRIGGVRPSPPEEHHQPAGGGVDTRSFHAALKNKAMGN